MALETKRFLGFPGPALNSLDDRLAIGPQGFRRLFDVSLEDGQTLQFPPGDLRLNATRINSGAAVRMIAEYNKADGTRYRYVKAGTEIRTFDLSGAISAAVKTGLTNDAIPGWVVHNDLFILCDPSGNWVSNGTVWGPLGADAPSAPSLALAAGNELEVGAYSYKIALRSSVLSQESTLSSAAAITTTGGNERVTLSGLPTLDSIWDEIKIYRTLVGGSSYFLVATRTVSTDYTDTMSDATAATQTPAPSNDTVRPPAAKFPVVHQNKLFLFNLTNDADAGRFSEAGFPYRFPTANRITFNVKDGDDVTGAWVQGGRLYVAKKNRVFILVGDSASNYELVEEVSGGLGVGAERCTTPITFRLETAQETRMFCLDLERGPFVKGPTGASDISRKMLPTVRGFKGSRADKFVGGHEPTSKAWWISVTSTTAGTANDFVFAYHYETGGWSQLRLAGVGAFGEVHDASERLRLIYGTDDGFLHLVDGDSYGARASLGGDVTGAPAATSTTTSIVTTGTLTTTGEGWKAEYLTILYRNAAGQVTSIERKKITSNTATTFTTAAFTTAPTTTDLWFVGAFYMDAITGQSDLGLPENRKHCPYWWVYMVTQSHSVKMYGAIYVDDDNDDESEGLAGFTANDQGIQQLPVRRGGGGRRPVRVSARFVAVGSNHPQQVKGWAIAAGPSAAA